MNRPKHASWIVPLMIAYGLGGAGMAGLAMVGALIENSREAPIIVANGLLIGGLWIAVFWAGVRFVRLDDGAPELGVVAAGWLMWLAPLGLAAIYISPIFMLASTSVSKAWGTYYLVDNFYALGEATIYSIFLGTSIIDFMILLPIFWFCRRAETRSWIAAAQESQPED